MKVTLKKWEVERVKNIVSDLLQLYTFDSISASTRDGRELSMSIETFIENLERDLNNPNL